MTRALLFTALLVPAVVHAAPKSFSASEEAVIKGEVLKPEITVVISRENLNKAYDLELDEDFLQRIVDSVKAPPF
jgi:hypothetical protein